MVFNTSRLVVYILFPVGPYYFQDNDLAPNDPSVFDLATEATQLGYQPILHNFRAKMGLRWQDGVVP